MFIWTSLIVTPRLSGRNRFELEIQEGLCILLATIQRQQIGNLDRAFGPGCWGRIGILIVILCFVSTITRANNISWTNTAGGNWSVAANWSPNVVPSFSDNVFITNSGTYAVTL